MNKSTGGHTPGPWVADIRSNAQGVRHVLVTAGPVSKVGRGGSITIFKVEAGRQPLTTETAANARLIAAAPDLLEALRSALAGDQGWAAYAQDTIAKATS